MVYSGPKTSRAIRYRAVLRRWAFRPILRNSRSLDRALAELEGMVGLASVKTEIRKLIDVLAAERERARLGHRAEPQALHRVP